MEDLIEKASFCHSKTEGSRLHGFTTIEDKWVITACGKWLSRENTILTEDVNVRIPCKTCLNC